MFENVFPKRVKVHEHSKFNLDGYQSSKSIDFTIEFLLSRIDWLKSIVNSIPEIVRDIRLIQSELYQIHEAYRAELCGTCCHESVCSHKNGIKYGDECANHDFPCEFGIELCEVEPEPIKEENSCCSNSGDGD